LHQLAHIFGIVVRLDESGSVDGDGPLALCWITPRIIFTEAGLGVTLVNGGGGDGEVGADGGVGTGISLDVTAIIVIKSVLVYRGDGSRLRDERRLDGVDGSTASWCGGRDAHAERSKGGEELDEVHGEVGWTEGSV
jgi:hypothetical protein